MILCICTSALHELGDMNFAYFTAGLGGSGAVNLLHLGLVFRSSGFRVLGFGFRVQGSGFRV